MDNYPNLFIRRATLEDLMFMFNLRNEEGVRRVSFNSDLIDLEIHRKWLEKKLAGDESVIFIAEDNLQPIGQVRFDWINNKEAEINIAITEKFRGRGYGSEILYKSSNQFLKEFSKCLRIYAYIKPDNKVSIHSFERAGYKFQKNTEHKNQVCVEMVLLR